MREDLSPRLSSTFLRSPLTPPISGGQPLPGFERRFFEPRFGYDFSRVLVHQGPKASETARAVDARAFTMGRNILFGEGQYQPGTSAGRQLLAHELVHVVQQGQGMSPMRLQRLVRTSLVTCPTGQSPVSSDRRASSLLDRALTRIRAARAARAANPADPDVVAVGVALRTAFRLNPANDETWTQGAPQVKLPVIARRLEIAKNYIDSVVFTVNCIAAGASHVIPGCSAGTCDPGTEAFSCPANTTGLVLCPTFWTRSIDQRGRTWAHEVFHINFGFIHDWHQPDVHNAHCYAQFIALLNGFNSPAGFRCH